jgi:LasA protease
LVYGAGLIATGYYGWREGTIVSVRFSDLSRLRMAATLNCGTAGLMNYFGQKYSLEAWADAIYGESSFITQYEAMFGNPWLTAQAYEPLFTPDVKQPDLILPFEPGVTWSFTGGPHAAWGAAEVRAAIDFAPPSEEIGCNSNQSWAVASAPGLVVRSENGVVVLDLDGDGSELTGWNLIYLHIATNDRIRLGSWLNTGDRIGHPSCEGGISSGTHLHMARKYNGEWVPAEGPLPFVLDGWKAKAGIDIYQGWLIRGDQIVRANLYGTLSSHVGRPD